MNGGIEMLLFDGKSFFSLSMEREPSNRETGDERDNKAGSTGAWQTGPVRQQYPCKMSRAGPMMGARCSCKTKSSVKTVMTGKSKD